MEVFLYLGDQEEEEEKLLIARQVFGCFLRKNSNGWRIVDTRLWKNKIIVLQTIKYWKKILGSVNVVSSQAPFHLHWILGNTLGIPHPPGSAWSSLMTARRLWSQADRSLARGGISLLFTWMTGRPSKIVCGIMNLWTGYCASPNRAG